jgi:hypothetical protein
LRHEGRVVGHEHVFEHQVARDRGAHAQRVPVALHREAGRGARHGQVQGVAARQIGVGFFLGAQHPKKVGGIGQRGKDFFAVDFPAAIDLHGRGAKGLRTGSGSAALRERLRVNGTVLHHAGEMRGLVRAVDGTLLGRHLQVFRQQAAPEHGAHMHVEGECRGAAVAPNLGRHHGIGGVVGAVAAVRLGHAQRQQPGRAHVLVIGKWELRIAVQLRSAWRELVTAQLPCQRHQLLLLVGQRKIVATNGHDVWLGEVLRIGRHGFTSFKKVLNSALNAWACS